MDDKVVHQLEDTDGAETPEPYDIELPYIDNIPNLSPDFNHQAEQQPSLPLPHDTDNLDAEESTPSSEPIHQDLSLNGPISGSQDIMLPSAPTVSNEGENITLTPPANDMLGDSRARRIRKTRALILDSCICGNTVTAGEIETGDLVMACKVPGCETVWVCAHFSWCDGHKLTLFLLSVSSGMYGS